MCRWFSTPLLVLLAVFIGSVMIALLRDPVIASSYPTAWSLKAIFVFGDMYGVYLAESFWALFVTASQTQVSLCKPCSCRACSVFKQPALRSLCRVTWSNFCWSADTDCGLLVCAVFQEQTSHAHLTVKTKEIYRFGVMMTVLPCLHSAAR